MSTGLWWLRLKWRLFSPTIFVFENMILDGSQVLRACLEAGVTPRFFEFVGNDPVGFVIARNHSRKHLTTVQRAAAIIKCRAWQPSGRPQKGDCPSPFFSVEQLAAECGVSERTVQRLKAAESAGIGDRVVSGEVGAFAAGRLAEGKPAKTASRPKIRDLRAERDSLAKQVQEKETLIKELTTRVSDLTAELARFRNKMPEGPVDPETTIFLEPSVSQRPDLQDTNGSPEVPHNSWSPQRVA